MKSTLLIMCLTFLTVSAHAGGSDVGNSDLQSAGASVELDAKAAKTIGNLLRKANLAGNVDVIFQGGPDVTVYSVEDTSCYFQNAGDFVSCSTVPELSAKSSQVIGGLLRKANLAGNRSVEFIGGPNVTQYKVGTLSCYFQNSDDSVSCGVEQ